MERGAKPKTKVKARPSVVRKSRKIDGSTGPQLKQRLAEALEQQTATSAILRVISQSPTDVKPVFDAIVKSAVRLCEARFGAVFRLDGGLVHLAAHHNFSEAMLARWSGLPARIAGGRLEIAFTDETQLEELVESLERATP